MLFCRCSSCKDAVLVHGIQVVIGLARHIPAVQTDTFARVFFDLEIWGKNYLKI
jgi:hypothetical protein